MCTEASRAEGVSREEPEMVLKGVWKRLVWKNTRETVMGTRGHGRGCSGLIPPLAPQGSVRETEAWPSAELILAPWPLPSSLPTLHGPHSPGRQGEPVLEIGDFVGVWDGAK